MRLPLYQIDAFARRPFAGNPAAVCPLPAGEWPGAALMQQIAAENNLAETAFFRPSAARPSEFDLRWFTPAAEIDLCGHATLASAHVLFEHLGFRDDSISFHTLSGPLHVSRAADGRLTLDFPSRPPQPLPALPPGLAAALGGAVPTQALASRDLVAVFPTEAEVQAIAPDFAQMLALDYVGIIATAPGAAGTDTDFVSRFFGPRVGVPEDPVTGSAHSSLIPLWAEKLGKTALKARQISARGGELWCELRGARVGIGGYAVTYLRGEIEVEVDVK